MTVSRLALLCASVIAATLLLSERAAGQCGASVSGRFGGEISAVAQINSTALLVARGTEVEAYSLLNPSAPAVFSPRRKTSLASPALKIAMTQGSSRAFVLMQNGDVEVLNLNYSPLLTVNVATTISTSDAVDILAEGQVVYIATMREVDDTPPWILSAIQVWDDSNGVPAYRSGVIPLTDQYGFDRLAKVGNVLWAGFHELQSAIFGVDGFDVTNLASPVRTGSALNNTTLGAWTGVHAMTAVGNSLMVSYAHASFGDDWLRAADVSSPTHPAWQPGVALGGVATTSSLIGTQLRVALAGSGVSTWNVASPAAPVSLGMYSDSWPAINEIVSVNGTDYWAAGHAGLMTMNTTNPAAITARSSPIVPLPIGPSVVRQRGNTTVVLDDTLNVLRLYDYTLAEAQQLRSTISLPNGAALVELADLNGGATTLACVATQYGNSSISVIDITNPAAPALRSTITGFTANLMSASTSRLYVMTTNNEFKIIELSQPLAPVVRSSTPFGGSSGDYTCMTSWSNNAAAIGTVPYGLWLVNTTDATAPVVSAVWNPVTGYRVNSLAKGNNYLYVNASVGSTPYITSDTRLESINVANIAGPSLRFVSHNGAGAGSLGEFKGLKYVSSPAGKFLVATYENEDWYSPVPEALNQARIFEVPPGFLTNVGVPFVLPAITIPWGHGDVAPNADGSKIMLPGYAAGLVQVAMPASWAPGFGLQPIGQSTCAGNSVTFSVFASGNPTTVTYQWYRDGVAMTDGPTPLGTLISGTTTTALHFDNLHEEDAWAAPYEHHVYYCIASNSCGSTQSIVAYLELCYANCDCSTVWPVLNVNDFLCFLNRFAAGDPYANCDNSTSPPTLNVLDFACFLNKFAAGCW